MFEVLIKPVRENFIMPVRAYGEAAAFDAYACEREIIINEALNMTIVKYYLGFALQPPPNMKVKLSARSSVYKTGLILANGVGLGDPDYRGEYQAIFYALGRLEKIYDVGERVCQIEFEMITPIKLHQVVLLGETERGEGGFGSSGNT